MTETIARIRSSLKGLYPENEISAFSRLILEHVSGMPFHKILLGKDKDLSDTQKRRIDKIITGLKAHQPIQYLLGEEEFFGLNFKVTPDVLIPRPETAELVGWIISDLKDSPAKLLDIGTGSGCIAISLAHALPQATVSAIDVSKEALLIAQENAEKLNVQVDFKRQDLLAPDASRVLAEWLGSPIDTIISNPPYIPEREKSDMEANVVEHEPGIALFVPNDKPLLFYSAIAKIGKKILKPGGTLYFEINALYGKELRSLLMREGYSRIEIRKDFYGKERMAKATNGI